jgi:hypothetical protein
MLISLISIQAKEWRDGHAYWELSETTEQRQIESLLEEVISVDLQTNLLILVQ